MRVNSTFSKPDILDVLSFEGIELNQKGRAFWTSCPLHSEKTASFKVDAENQRFHCFGCGASGDAIGFIMQYRNLSFPEALKHLGIDTDKPFKPDPVEKRKKELLQGFKAWQQSYFLKLCDCLINLDKVKRQITDLKELEAFAWAYHAESLWNYHIEILTGKDTAALVALFREVCHGE